MFDTDYAIRAQKVGKTYRLGTTQTRASTFAEAMVNRVRHRTPRNPVTSFDALDDVSFDLPRGEALGIVGRNGAGKSTLLKILTRVTAPTRGRIEFRGRMGSLLEVGTGFHPELTGRENVYLNGALLGMTRAEVARQFDAIVDFSNMEKFLETPVKRYSSGMYVRLAFAVAAHLETEILAIDEVLAVGDAEFQRRSLDKMREAAKQGRTVLYVSHQLQTVKDLCTSAIMLERGRLVHQGTVDSALEAYAASFERYAADQLDPSNRQGSGKLRFRNVEMEQQTVSTGDALSLTFDIPAGADPNIPEYWVAAHIVDDAGSVIAQCDSRLSGFTFDSAHSHSGRLSIKNLWLKPGSYSVDMYACQRTELSDVWDAACHFDVLPNLPYRATAAPEAFSHGAVLTDFEYEMD